MPDHTEIDNTVIVVGAGLSGLACATDLSRAGHRVLLLEAADRVGGRMRSDVVDGFVIDAGFQVLNTAYPALNRYADLDAVDLRRLPRGVRVRRGGTLHALPHPLAAPAAPLGALASGVTGLRGKVALAAMVARILARSPAALASRPDVPASRAWATQVPAETVDGVLVPFFSGVVLDPAVDTSRVFTDLMMRAFARGHSAVPNAGMQRLPEHLAAALPPGTLRLGTPVASVHADGVRLADGSWLEAGVVVVATDPWTARDLVPELGDLPPTRGVTTYYFAASPVGTPDGTVSVDADGSGVATSTVLTASAPGYSRDARHLIATSVFHEDGAAVLDAAAAEAVARDLHRDVPGHWDLVATRDIPHALLAMPAPLTLRKRTWFEDPGVWVAGDHRDTSSIQGALASGGRVARRVHQHLTTTRVSRNV